MKEYILVILSGICKAVEKTNWPEEYVPVLPEPKHSENVSRKKYERQKLKAFEGGALVDDQYSKIIVCEHLSGGKEELNPIDKFLTLSKGKYQPCSLLNT